MPYNKSLSADAENAPSLREAFAGRFRVGAAINSWHLNENSREYAVIRKQFNVFTLENESKPEPIHP
jgi:endo-1,4-beta-xylanase